MDPAPTRRPEVEVVEVDLSYIAAGVFQVTAVQRHPRPSVPGENDRPPERCPQAGNNGGMKTRVLGAFGVDAVVAGTTGMGVRAAAARYLRTEPRKPDERKRIWQPETA